MPVPTAPSSIPRRATACTTSAHCVGDSFRIIQRGEADVMICCGTEACITPMGVGGFAALRALLVEAGLTPLQALQAATLTAAQALHHERDLGTIEPGKLADMMLIQGNPLQDIHAAKNVRLVFRGGRVYDPKLLLKQ